MFGRKPSQASRLDNILATFRDVANSDYDQLRALVPPEEMWRLFIDGIDQNHKEDVAKHLTNTSYLKELYRIQKTLLTPEKIDEINRLNRGWITYECQEQGYLKAMFCGYQYAASTNDELSLDLIFTLHRYAMTNVERTNYSRYVTVDKPGQIRSHSNCQFPISAANASYDGIMELLAEFTPHMSFCVNGMQVNGGTIPEFRDEKISIHAERFKSQYPLYFSKLLLVNNRADLAKWIFNLLNDDDIFVSLQSIQTSNTVETLTKYAQEYIDQAQQEFLAAKKPLDSLRAMVRFNQRMLRLHMFLDGHGRTFCMLLREYFARKYQLPMMILHQPSAYSACSLSELVDEHLDGMENVFKLIETGKLFNVSSTDLLLQLSVPNTFGVTAEYFHALTQMETESRMELALNQVYKI